jgi:hypothetical protein
VLSAQSACAACAAFRSHGIGAGRAPRGPARGARARARAKTEPPPPVKRDAHGGGGLSGVYARNAWGGAPGELCSGAAVQRRNSPIPYAEVIGRRERSRDFNCDIMAHYTINGLRKVMR